MERKKYYLCALVTMQIPVAEKIFKNLDSNFEIKSAGTNALNVPFMDERSQEYLIMRKLDSNHFSKNLTEEMLLNFDLIFALDIHVYEKLKKYKSFNKANIKLINYFDFSLNMNDPIKFKNKNDYFEILDNIHTCCLEIFKRIESKELT